MNLTKMLKPLVLNLPGTTRKKTALPYCLRTGLWSVPLWQYKPSGAMDHQAAQPGLIMQVVKQQQRLWEWVGARFLPDCR